MSEVRPAIVRGNASEIRALASEDHGTKGVDSTHAAKDALEFARGLARQYGMVVTISGATDYIVSADAALSVANGHAMMPRVTGLGCTATALCAAFAAINPVPIDAAAHAMAVMGIAGELAAAQAAGPGSFLVRFMDALYALSEADVRSRLRMERA